METGQAPRTGRASRKGRIQFNVWIDAGDRAWLDQYAESRDRSAAQVVRGLVRDLREQNTETAAA
jgi:hypothetical protein